MNATPWENPVKKSLSEGRPVVAATITVNSVDVAAHAANMGFDFLWIEMEHSPITLETLPNHMPAPPGAPPALSSRSPAHPNWLRRRYRRAAILRTAGVAPVPDSRDSPGPTGRP